jgi:hypothetical protein
MRVLKLIQNLQSHSIRIKQRHYLTFELSILCVLDFQFLLNPPNHKFELRLLAISFIPVLLNPCPQRFYLSFK